MSPSSRTATLRGVPWTRTWAGSSSSFSAQGRTSSRRSTASSVEITEVIYNMKGKPVTGALPKSPLELGLVPPFCTNDSPRKSGENQNQGEEPDAESGVESNVTDESPGARSLPPRQERQPESNMNKVVTAAMKKGKPVSDLKDVLKAGIDPRKMPMNPENAPHSLLQSRRNQSVEREERLRAQGVSRPVALINVSRPVEPDSTRPEVVPQTKEEMEASTNEWIRKARHQKKKRKLQPKPPKEQQNDPETQQTPTHIRTTNQENKITTQKLNQEQCAHLNRSSQIYV